MSVLNNSQIVDMTTAIERVPFKPGLLTSMGLFRGVSVNTDAVTFDVRENSLAVLDDHLRNVAQKNGMEDVAYDIHTLAIPSYPLGTPLVVRSWQVFVASVKSPNRLLRVQSVKNWNVRLNVTMFTMNTLQP